MTVFITGGTGFLGEALTGALLDRGEEVVCVDLDPSTRHEGREGFSVGEVDVTDYRSVSDALRAHRPDRLVHLAYALGAASEANPGRAIEVNCLGTNNVFRAAADTGVDRVVFASSAAAYGRPTGDSAGGVAEDDVVPAAYSQYPVMMYSATKQLNEYQARHYADETGLEVASIRPGLVFGPGRESGLTQWASTFVAGPARSGTGHVPFRPEEELPMIYRDDVVDLFERVVAADALEHAAYNTGCHTVTAGALAQLVERVTGGTVTCDPDAGPARFVSAIDHGRAAAEFGYELTPLEDGVRAHAEAVADARDESVGAGGNGGSDGSGGSASSGRADGTGGGDPGG